MNTSTRGIINKEAVPAKYFKMYKAGKRWMVASLTIAAIGVGSQLNSVNKVAADTTPVSQGSETGSQAGTTATAESTNTPAQPTATQTQPDPTDNTQATPAVVADTTQTETTATDQTTAAKPTQTQAETPVVDQQTVQPTATQVTPAQPQASQDSQITNTKSETVTAEKNSAPTPKNESATQSTKAAPSKQAEKAAASSNEVAKDQPKTASPDTQTDTPDENLTYDQAVKVYDASKQLYGVITTQLDKAKNEYDQQLNVYKDKLAEYNQARNQYQNDETKYVAEKAAYDKAKGEYEAARKAYDQKKVEHDNAKTLSDQAGAAFNTAQDKVEAAVTEHAAQKTEYDQALAKYETAREAYEAARVQYEKGQGTQTDAQFKTIEDQYTQTKKTYDTTEAEFKTIQAAYDGTQKQIDDLQPQFNDADAKGKAASDQFKTIDAEYQRINDQYQQAHTKFDQLEQQFTGLGLDFIKQTDAFNQIKADFDEVKAGHDQLAQRYSVAQGAYDTLAKRMSELNDQYLIELKNYQDETKVWDEAYAEAMAYEKSVAESLAEKTVNPVLPGLNVTAPNPTVDIGDDGVFDLHFDANGIRTQYTNAELIVNLPQDKGVSFDTSDLSQFEIAGATPTYDAATRTLTYHWDSLASGVSQDLHYVYTTDKSGLVNNQTVQMGLSFTSDEITTPVTMTASQSMAISISAMITNKPANTFTDEFGKEYKNPAQEDTAKWDFIVSIPTSQPKTALLEPGSNVDIYYYVAGNQSFVGLTPATADNGLIDTPPEISTGELPDGTPATILKWTFKAGDVQSQMATDQTMKFQVIAKVNKDAANFQWVKTDVGIGLTFQGAQPIKQITNKIAATMVMPHDPTTWNVTGGTWKPMVHYGSSDGVGGLADGDLLNPDPQIYSDANALLQFYDALFPVFLFNDLDSEVPEKDRVHDFNYYALHQTIDPREDLNEIIIHNFVYQPSGSIKNSVNPSGAVGEWAYFKENPYLSLAVKYQGEGENQYHTLFENLPTLVSDVELDENGKPVFSVSGQGSKEFIYVNRQQLLAAGLDPTKNVVEVYMYMHKKGMGEIPKNPDTISRESMYQYPDYPYKAYHNETVTITDKNDVERMILKRDVLKSPEEGGLPAGSWAPYGTYGGVYFETIVKSNAEPGTIVHQMTPKVSWSNTRTFMSLEDWMSDASAPDGSWRWLAKDEAEKQASIDGSTGWPGVVWQFLKPSTVEIGKSDKSATRYVTSAIFLDGKASGSVLQPGSHELTLGFILDKSSIGNVVAQDGPFETYTVLPKGVTFDNDASMKTGVIPFGNEYSVINDFNGTGQQVLKIVWTDKSVLTPGKNGATRVVVNIDSTTNKDMIFQNFINLGSDKENYIISVPNITQPTLGDSQKIADGSATGLIETKTPLITSGTYYVLDKDAKLQSSQLVTQAGKDDYHHAVAVETGKEATVKITFTENTDPVITHLDLLDFLPQAGAIEGATTTDVRASTYTAGLTGPVSIPSDWTGKVNVYYTTEDQATMLQDLNSVTWQLQNSVTDWSKITAFRIMLNGTSGQSINSIPTEGITFNVSVPDKSTFISKYAETGKQMGVGELNDRLKEEVAYNSYIVAVNHLGYTEPLLSAIKVVNVGDKTTEPTKPTLDETHPTNNAEEPVAPVAPTENAGGQVVNIDQPTVPDAGNLVVEAYKPNLDQPKEPVAPVAPKKAENPVDPSVDPNHPVTPVIPTPETPVTPAAPVFPVTPKETAPTFPQSPVHIDTAENEEPGLIDKNTKTPEVPKQQPTTNNDNTKDQLEVNDSSKVVKNDAQTGPTDKATSMGAAKETTSGETTQGGLTTLPQTGDTNTGQSVSIIGMILLAMFGWLGFGKKRKREE